MAARMRKRSLVLRLPRHEIRIGRPRDHPSIVDLLVEAFEDEPLCCVIWPGRKRFFGQRPRRGPEGTLVLCIRGNCVRPSVRTYVRTDVRPPPLAGPLSPRARSLGPQARPLKPQCRPLELQISLLRPQAKPQKPQASPLKPPTSPLRPQARPLRPLARPLKFQISPLKLQASSPRPQVSPLRPQASPLRP